MSETAIVNVAVLAFEPVRGPVGMVGLAIVEVEVAGVALVLQGVRVLRDGNGGLACQPPVFRHPSGRWLPALLMPPELTAAIGAEVLSEAQGGDGSKEIPSRTHTVRSWISYG